MNIVHGRVGRSNYMGATVDGGACGGRVWAPRVLEEIGVFVLAGEPYLRQTVLIAFQGIGLVFNFLSRVQDLWSTRA